MNNGYLRGKGKAREVTFKKVREQNSRSNPKTKFRESQFQLREDRLRRVLWLNSCVHNWEVSQTSGWLSTFEKIGDYGEKIKTYRNLNNAQKSGKVIERKNF